MCRFTSIEFTASIAGSAAHRLRIPLDNVVDSLRSTFATAHATTEGD